MGQYKVIFHKPQFSVGDMTLSLKLGLARARIQLAVMSRTRKALSPKKMGDENSRLSQDPEPNFAPPHLPDDQQCPSAVHYGVAGGFTGTQKTHCEVVWLDGGRRLRPRPSEQGSVFRHALYPERKARTASIEKRRSVD
jgi:hypothetical protein